MKIFIIDEPSKVKLNGVFIPSKVHMLVQKSNDSRQYSNYEVAANNKESFASNCMKAYKDVASTIQTNPNSEIYFSSVNGYCGVRHALENSIIPSTVKNMFIIDPLIGKETYLIDINGKNEKNYKKRLNTMLKALDTKKYNSVACYTTKNNVNLEDWTGFKDGKSIVTFTESNLDKIRKYKDELANSKITNDDDKAEEVNTTTEIVDIEDPENTDDTPEENVELDSKYKYVRMKSSEVYHSLDCYLAKRIKDNLRIYYTEEDIVDCKLKPCAKCLSKEQSINETNKEVKKDVKSKKKDNTDKAIKINSLKDIGDIAEQIVVESTNNTENKEIETPVKVVPTAITEMQNMSEEEKAKQLPIGTLTPVRVVPTAITEMQNMSEEEKAKQLPIGTLTPVRVVPTAITEMQNMTDEEKAKQLPIGTLTPVRVVPTAITEMHNKDDTKSDNNKDKADENVVDTKEKIDEIKEKVVDTEEEVNDKNNETEGKQNSTDNSNKPNSIYICKSDNKAKLESEEVSVIGHEIIKICNRYGLYCEVSKSMVQIFTVAGGWKFNYNKRPIELFHQNSKTMMGGKKNIDYHSQGNDFNSPLEIIGYILKHDNAITGKIMKESMEKYLL